MSNKKFISCFLALLAALIPLSGCAGTPSSSQSAQGAISTSNSTQSDSPASYSENDLDASWNDATATKISLDGTSATISGNGASSDGSTVTITNGGTYILSGTLTDGQVVVDAPKADKVQLVLNNVSITSQSSAPIYAKQADKIYITLAPDSQNTLADADEYVYAAGEDEPNAALFSKDDLVINGSGTLDITGNYHNGIASKDDLTIASGTFHISAANDAIRGKDSVSIADGVFNLTAAGDGIKSDNDTDATKGWISLDGGTYNITAQNDGVQAQTNLFVNGGEYTVVTGGGAAAAPAHTSGGFGGGRPGGGMRGQPPEMPVPAGTDGASTAMASSDPPPEMPALTGGNAFTAVTIPTPPDVPMSPPDGAQTAAASEETAESMKGFKSGTLLAISGGTFNLDCADDSLHTNGDMQITGGTFTISTGDDGFHADNAMTIDAGEINIEKSYEGIEGDTIDINGGTIALTASDDGLNAAGGNDSSGQNGPMGGDHFASSGSSYIRVAGGSLLVNASGDGIDSNGALYFSGGATIVNGPTGSGNGALDYDSTCEVTGGILVTAGSSGMAQAPGSGSTQNTLSVYFTQRQEAGTLFALLDSAGKCLLTFAPEKAYQNINVSIPELKTGESYTVSTGGSVSGDTENGLTLNGTYSGGTTLCTATLSDTVTKISDDGSAVTGRDGMGSGRPGNMGQRPEGSMAGQGRHNRNSESAAPSEQIAPA